MKRHLTNQCKALLELYVEASNEEKEGPRRTETFDFKNR